MLTGAPFFFITYVMLCDGLNAMAIFAAAAAAAGVWCMEW